MALPRSCALGFAAPLLCALTTAHAQPALLVRDIDPASNTAASSNPQGFTRVGSSVLFFADAPGMGMEVWKTDGTPTGTVVVKDTVPGRSSPQTYGFIAGEGAACFLVRDDEGSVALWKTDGTPEGTVAVKPISNPQEFAFVNGTLFFSADDGAHGTELWKSDGTEAGTVFVKDVQPGEQGSDIGHFVGLGSSVLFAADDGEHGRALWKTDGTEAGTVLLKDLDPSSTSSNLENLVRVGDKVFFSAYRDDTGGWELWVSDGTVAGTGLVKDIAPVGESRPQNLTAFQGALFFSAWDPAGGNELWRSDGTEAGTARVKEIAPGAASASPSSLVVVGETLYFTADDGVHGDALWATDGTAEGTKLVKDIVPSGASSPQELTGIGGVVYFRASTADEGGELWRSDGTEEGTRLVKDIVPGATGSYPTRFAVLGETLLFAADDGVHGGELWASDGTAEGTRLLADIAGGGKSGWPTHLTDIAGRLHFAANDGIHGTEPWTSDGTAAGTALLKDVNPGSTASSPSGFTWAERTYFAAQDSTSGREIWTTDGTGDGTTRVTDVCAGNGDSFTSWDTPALPFAGELFFGAGCNSWSTLYRTDGTTTSAVRTTAPVPRKITQLTPVSDLLFFSAEIVDGDRELFKSDGTDSGTGLVKNINPTAFSDPKLLGALGDIALLAAWDETHGSELWKSDGTEEGTVLLKEFIEGAEGGGPGAPGFVIGDEMLFQGRDLAHGHELWKTDGTEAGTVLVKDINPGPEGSNLLDLVLVGDRVFFVAFHPDHGFELWTSDGTESGTHLVRDLVPGPKDAIALNSGRLAAVPSLGQVVFSAYQPDTGIEVWHSDGTAEGTRLLADVWPGALSSDPISFQASGAHVYFNAFHPDYGYELWAVPVSALDMTPPSITVQVSGQEENGWFTSDVTVHFVGEDAQSEVTSLVGCEEVSFTSDTPGETLTCVAVSTGGSATASVTIRRDTAAPSITCPEDISAEAETASGGTARFTNPVVSDTCDPAPRLELNASSGAFFPIGETVVTALATDAAGRTQSCSFKVRVADTTAPTVSCPANLTLEATSAAGANATWSAPVASDSADDSPRVITSSPSGAVFPLGKTTITATAFDTAGNQSSCTFEVTVGDTTAPTLVCPGEITVAAADASGAVVQLPAVSVVDRADPNVQVLTSPPSGATFPVGRTVVTVSASDASGNGSTCSFPVVVEAATVAEEPEGCGCGTGGSALQGGWMLALMVGGLGARRRR